MANTSFLVSSSIAVAVHYCHDVIHRCKILGRIDIHAFVCFRHSAPLVLFRTATSHAEKVSQMGLGLIEFFRFFPKWKKVTLDCRIMHMGFNDGRQPE